MSAEQKTSHRGFTIITVLERLSKGRARLSAKVLANDEGHKQRLGGKKLLQAKRWFDHFADDLADPVIAGLKHTIDLELAAAARTAAAKAKVSADTAKPAKPAKAAKLAKPAKPTKAIKATKSVKPAKPAKAATPAKSAKPAKATKPAKPAKPTSPQSGKLSKVVKPAKQAPVGTPAAKPLKTVPASGAA
ncbi:hypothetical protein PIN31009_03313 [Pandoraea iniqua]|uniref:hypothetical protein n=1 Tax=Pandoraea iniqua TaxID=2508288 RepID=UPI001258204F|nr:hypothetical protein [Pandoraea iniqua]VVE24981.1 hypothetical protein PIN31009_03313 [Pandoraea iniqua]